ncbi:tyrosine-type recombinase/integrase [Chloroflexota bacterium]
MGYTITNQGIIVYLANLKCDNGKAKFYSCLRALCNWLHRSGYITENPIKQVSPPRIQKRLLPVINQKQFEALMNYCLCTRDEALISLLWYSGMRISEAVSIRTNDFNWEEGTAIVLGKGNRYRKCLAGNGLIRQWFNEHDSFAITINGAQAMFKTLKAESGIACNVHSFRRGFCVHQVKSGLSTQVAQALGGWESITMVERYSRSFDFDGALELYRKVNGV